MATGSTFAHGKAIKSALEVNKTPRKLSKENRRNISLARMPSMDHLQHKAAPVTLLTAKDSQDAQQAWRTVRSYFGMEIFLEFDIGTPG